jgi:hypothetical protein
MTVGSILRHSHEGRHLERGDRRLAFRRAAAPTRTFQQSMNSLAQAEAFTRAASQSEALMVAVGFSPRWEGREQSRRVATPESREQARIKRRSATRRASATIRGLKATATVGRSLRDWIWPREL